MAEVINLSDDEDVCEITSDSNDGTNEPRPKIRRKCFRCLNSDCRTEDSLSKASEFVRRFYGVLKYPKKTRVCDRCRDVALEQENRLVDTVKSGRILIDERLPPPKDTVVLTDSESDPTDDELSADTEFELSYSDSSCSDVDAEIGRNVTDKFNNMLQDIVEKLGLERQLTEGKESICNSLLKTEEEYKKLNEEYRTIEHNLDSIRSKFYNAFRLDVRYQPTLDIGPPSMTVVVPAEEDVIAEASVYNPARNLPPVGPLLRPELSPGENVYSMKYSLFARWVAAVVIEIDRMEVNNTYYKIKYNRSGSGSGVPRVLSGRQLAYYDQCQTRIPVGTRVIAKYMDDDPKNNSVSGSYYVGVVAEIPTATNKYRYLIFFDDGYAQYVFHRDIRVVTQSSTCPWEDVASDSRDFIKEYLQTYPERPMVRLQKWNYVRTEWNGRWWKAQVLEVDGALGKMYFPTDGRTEWIYRGSTRLSPLFNKKMNMQAQAEQPHKAIRRRTAPGRGALFVEYGSHGQGQQDQNLEGNFTVMPERTERRAVARKSTASRPGTPPQDILAKIDQEGKGYLKKMPVEREMPKFVPHQCSSACIGVREAEVIQNFNNGSPLNCPSVCGWRRQIVRQRKRTVNRSCVQYVAPCGRRLRSMIEVFRYLRVTNSQLEIDCYTFEVSVDSTNVWEPASTNIFLEDITDGKEIVKISCINCLDSNYPQPLVYSNIRLPTIGVPLNLDADFLICCDCEDDCQNTSLCACWQLTLEAAQLLGNIDATDVGYKFRRLFEQVQTGIYECSSRCSCRKSCLNKVVQNPLRLRLQLFKTARRGWGVRTLHDIPQGGFICIYVGKMLEDSRANEEGRNETGGDDYYAELDFIEVVENIKEGYEDDVEEPEIDSNVSSQKPDKNTPDSESEETESGNMSGAEVDCHKSDKSYKGSKHISSKKLQAREKSARLQARASLLKAKGDKNDEENSENDQSPDQNSANMDESSRSSAAEETMSTTDSSSVVAKEGLKDPKESEKEVESNKEGGESDNAKSDYENEEEEEQADERLRKPQNFSARLTEPIKQNPRKSLRQFFGTQEAVYIMDAKHTGNIGRYLNHSCQPNVFVQNVFVDTHDPRFPWVAFFAATNIRAGSELTWDYNYEVGCVPGKIKYCYCGARRCRGRLL